MTAVTTNAFDSSNGNGHATTSRVDALAAALEQHGCDVAPRSDGYLAQCPGHDDHKPSLSIGASEDGRALVYCYAGCSAEEVVSAIGWALSDLFANGRKHKAGKGKRGRRPVKPPAPLGADAARNSDACHSLLFAPAENVLRSPLAQLHRNRGISHDVARGARLGLDGRAYVIPHFRDGHLVGLERYTLPEYRREGQHGLRVDKGTTRWLYQAQPNREDELAIICEGSMDALAVLSATGRRVAATPSAKVWRDEWSREQYASGVRRAVVLFDCDPAGRKGAEAAVSSLRAAGIAAWRLDLDPCRADGYDATNYVLEHGGEALDALLFEDGDAMCGALRDYFASYLVVRGPILDVLAVWTVHTHAFDSFETTPYLNVSSAEKGSGKTHILEALQFVVAKPWLTGDATAAVLKRRIDRDHPTLLLDESDNTFAGDRDRASALRAILNTGFQESGQASLCIGPDNELVDLSTFCPKAFAGIGAKQLPDTVADRSIPVRMKKATRAELASIKKFRRREVKVKAAPLHAACERWTAQHLDALRDARPDVPDEYDGRTADITEPLLAIAEAVGGEWPRRVRDALARLLTDGERVDTMSDGSRLLADVRAVWPEGEDKVPSAVLVQRLINAPESIWADLGYGKQLTTAELARRLGEYGIRSRSIRTDAGTPKGYRRESFEDAWRRYVAALPPNLPPQRRNGATAPKTATNSRNTAARVAAANPPDLAPQADCGGVAAQTAGEAPHTSPLDALGKPYKPRASALSTNGQGNT